LAVETKTEELGARILDMVEEGVSFQVEDM
jgi:hypothetical protein